MEKTFLGKHILDTHSAANCHLQEFGKISRVFHENPIFSQKNQVLYVFENSYYSSRILRQLCYDLVVKNFQSQNRPHIRSSDILNWQVNVKNVRVEKVIFLPSIMSMAENNSGSFNVNEGNEFQHLCPTVGQCDIFKL